MLTALFHRCGLRAWQMQILSLSSVGLCIGLWIRAKTVDQDERGNAERRALFVGLWPPTIWLIGDSLARHERIPGPSLRRRAAWRRVKRVTLSRARAATVAVMALRVAYGAGLIAAPTRLGRRWLGPASATAPTQIPLQGLGMREIVLHTGAIWAALRGAPLGRGWPGASPAISPTSRPR